MRTITEILKSKGITEATRYHNYEYLYKAMVESCDEYSGQFHKPDVSGMVCPNCEGTGAFQKDQHSEIICVMCNGTGQTLR